MYMSAVVPVGRGEEVVEDDAPRRGCTGCSSSQRQRAPRRRGGVDVVPVNEGAGVFCAHGARPVGLAQLVTVRPPVSALVLADALFAHALYAISFTRCFCCFLLVSL
jgi:hypothetical protein